MIKHQSADSDVMEILKLTLYVNNMAIVSLG